MIATALPSSYLNLVFLNVSSCISVEDKVAPLTTTVTGSLIRVKFVRLGAVLCLHISLEKTTDSNGQ